MQQNYATTGVFIFFSRDGLNIWVKSMGKSAKVPIRAMGIFPIRRYLCYIACPDATKFPRFTHLSIYKPLQEGVCTLRVCRNKIHEKVVGFHVSSYF